VRFLKAPCGPFFLAEVHSPVFLCFGGIAIFIPGFSPCRLSPIPVLVLFQRHLLPYRLPQVALFSIFSKLYVPFPGGFYFLLSFSDSAGPVLWCSASSPIRMVLVARSVPAHKRLREFPFFVKIPRWGWWSRRNFSLELKDSRR